MHADGDWQAVERVLRKDMATICEYLQIWKMELSTTKMVSAVFHLNNKDVKRELKVNHNNETLPICSEPTFLRVTWTGRSRITDTLSHFARSWHHALHSWGGLLAPVRVLHQQRCEQPPYPWSFQNSTAEYCPPVWCRSTHTRLIDPVTNDALRTVTGWLRPIPTDNLPMLAGIQPAELRCKGATVALARRPMKPGHLSGNFKSRHSFVPAAQQLISSSDDNGRSAALWADHRWNADRLESTARLRTFTPYPPPLE